MGMMRKLALAISLFSVVHGWGQSSTHPVTVTISEPSTGTLANYWQKADVVAVVTTLAGDADSYESAVYKAKVVRPFKGVKEGEVLYFGPFVGTEIGTDYLLFLTRAKEALAPEAGKPSSFGVVPLLRVMNQGYGSMKTSYECDLADRSEQNSCDYVFRVCTDYVALPKNTPTSPREGAGTPFGCRFIRRTIMFSALDRISSAAH